MNRDKFVGICENKNYIVGCTGGSVHIYDKDSTELKRFKGLQYAYTCAFRPGTNIVVVKTNENRLYVYDADRLELTKKIRERGTNDDRGFAFSPDGRWLYNIEIKYPEGFPYERIAKYDTENYEVECYINEEHKHRSLKYIEFTDQGKCYLLGFIRDNKGIYREGFIAEMLDDEIKIVKKLDRKTYDYLKKNKAIEERGITKKMLELYHINREEYKAVPLEDVAENRWRLE